MTTEPTTPDPCCPVCEVARYLHERGARIYIDGREHRIITVGDDERGEGDSAYAITDEPGRWL